MLIDSHCHLTSSPLEDDLAGVLDRARAAGVSRCITIGTDVADCRNAVNVAARHEGVFAVVGVHPHEAGKATDADFATLADLYRHERVVAAGEMGLDYHYDFCDPPTQKRVFARQLEIARVANLPIVIHCRKAFEDTIAILRECNYADRRVVFHCFGGSDEEFATLDRFGWRASFTGTITFKNAGAFRERLRAHPVDRLMIETDAPYLTPEPLRKVKPNEPAYVVHVADCLADLHGWDRAEMYAQLTRNTEEFFALPSA